MRTHPEASAREIFVGNVCVRNGVRIGEHLASLEKARLGEQAYDLDGKKIPAGQMRPLLIDRSEAGQYDRIMMQRTFGERYR